MYRYHYTTRSDRSETIDERLFTLFIVLQLVGFCGSIIMFLTACVSPLVRRRHPIWFSFVVAWIISSASYSLLVGTPTDWIPPYPICLTQAAMIYTVPTLTASASLALIVHVLLTVRAVTLSDTGSSQGVWKVLLIFLPYLFGGGMFALSMVIGLDHHDTVTRPSYGFYCHMQNSLPEKLSAIIVTGIMIISLCLDMIICIILRKNWSFIANETHSPFGMVMRVLGFSVFSVVGVISGLIFLTPQARHNFGLEITLSLMPIAVILVFGTQKDFVQSWKAGCQACSQWVRSCLFDIIKSCQQRNLSNSTSSTAGLCVRTQSTY